MKDKVKEISQKLELKEKVAEDVKDMKFWDRGSRKREPRKKIGRNHSGIDIGSKLKESNAQYSEWEKA